MVKFDFYWPTRFIFGQGGVEKAGAEAAKIGSRALLVSGQGSQRKTGVLDGVLLSLERAGVKTVLFEGTEPNPKADFVDRGGALAREEGCDFVLGLGGGSVMDAAKGVAVSAAHPGSIWEYMNSFPVFREPGGDTLPVMAIPTVAGTGSEGNGTAVISNARTREKSFIKSDYIFPACSIIDPELTFSAPPGVTAPAGVDIVCHVLEHYINCGTSFGISFRMTEAIMLSVIENLGKALADGNDPEARENLSWASTLACSPFRGLGLSGTGSLHHIEHAVSGWFDVSHGAGLCALLPSWLEFMNRFARERIEQFGKNVFGANAIPSLRKWLEDVGMNLTLKDLGVRESALEKMAGDVIRVYGKGEDFIPNGRYRIFADDIVEVYRSAF